MEETTAVRSHHLVPQGGDSKMGKEKWFWAESSRRGGGAAGLVGGMCGCLRSRGQGVCPLPVRSCAERGQRGLRISTEAGILKTQRRRGLFQGSAISSEASPWNPPGLGAASVCATSRPLYRDPSRMSFSVLIVTVASSWKRHCVRPTGRRLPEWRTHLVPCHPLAGDT